jgi:hypothetical protein
MKTPPVKTGGVFVLQLGQQGDVTAAAIEWPAWTR